MVRRHLFYYEEEDSDRERREGTDKPDDSVGSIDVNDDEETVLNEFGFSFGLDDPKKDNEGREWSGEERRKRGDRRKGSIGGRRKEDMEIDPFGRLVDIGKDSTVKKKEGSEEDVFKNIWSVYSGLPEKIRSYIKKGVLTGAGLLCLAIASYSSGNKVYDDWLPIGENGQKRSIRAEYTEGKGFLGFRENRLTLWRKDMVCTFIDSYDEYGIEWENDNSELKFRHDELEEIVITKREKGRLKGDSYSFVRDDINKDDTKGKIARWFFVGGEWIYWEARKSIRSKLRNEYIEDAYEIRRTIDSFLDEGLPSERKSSVEKMKL